MSSPTDLVRVSVVIPLHNEVENVSSLVSAMAEVVQPHWEVVFVDDGSLDGTLAKLESETQHLPWARIVRHSMRSGQAAALRTGFEYARGELLITLDGDLQNDPRDISLLVQKLEDGFDFIIGARQKRQDGMLFRKIPSLVANWLLRRLLGYPFKDIGCGLRGYRRVVVQRLFWFGEMHRYASILTFVLGFRTLEVPVRHHPRTAGVAKYNLWRTLRIIRDLTMLLAITGRGANLSGLCALLGILCCLWPTSSRVFLPQQSTPILDWAMVCMTVCSFIWFFLTGYCYRHYMNAFSQIVLRPPSRGVESIK